MKETGGAKYVFSGVTEGRANCGVGIIVAERLANCVRSWRCISERCVMIRLRVAGVWMTLVQVYAPTDDRDNETKDGFYAPSLLAPKTLVKCSFQTFTASSPALTMPSLS